MKKRVVLLILVPLLFASTCWPQEEEKPTSRIYEIKWKSAADIADLINNNKFGSNIVNIIPNRAFNIVTVVATEAGHAFCQGLVKKYDVPARTIEFQFYLIEASGDGSGIKDGLPEKIRAVLGEVASLTRYSNFRVIDAPVIRAQEGNRLQLSGSGEYVYSLSTGGLVRIVGMGTKGKVLAENLSITFDLPYRFTKEPTVRKVGLTTDLTMEDGETVVIGASQVQEAGVTHKGPVIITVVTAKILN
jgi:hypothetical protein